MIDAKELYEFMKSYNAMCRETESCIECELHMNLCFGGVAEPSFTEIESIVKTVEKWKTKHEKEIDKDLLRHESTVILNEFVEEAKATIEGLNREVKKLKEALEACSEKLGEVLR